MQEISGPKDLLKSPFCIEKLMEQFKIENSSFLALLIVPKKILGQLNDFFYILKFQKPTLVYLQKVKVQKSRSQKFNFLLCR